MCWHFKHSELGPGWLADRSPLYDTSSFQGLDLWSSERVGSSKIGCCSSAQGTQGTYMSGDLAKFDKHSGLPARKNFTSLCRSNLEIWPAVGFPKTASLVV